MDRRQFLRGAMGSTGLAGLLAFAGCEDSESPEKPKYLGYEEHPVDQVFKDCYGYRALFTDKESIVRERKYRDYKDRVTRPREVPEDIKRNFLYFEKDLNHEVFVIKDLEEGQRGFARAIKYSIFRHWDPRTYAEIHIPKNLRISPGIDATGGKFSRDVPMYEVD